MCNCIEEVNEILAPHNTVLDQISLINMKTGTVRHSLHVATSKIGRGKQKAKLMTVTFCPFCGERVNRSEEPEAA
jgi:hypothetical protein